MLLLVFESSSEPKGASIPPTILLNADNICKGVVGLFSSISLLNFSWLGSQQKGSRPSQQGAFFLLFVECRAGRVFSAGYR